jgi:hypothetical protein
MPNLISGAARAAVEGFVGTQSSEKRRDAYVDFVTVIVAFVVALIIIGFVGKLLWNNVVVDLFTVVKPARSVWQIIGLMFLVALMMP